MYERLLEILNGAGVCKVLLVGDFMLDNYLFGDIDRISPEAPVVVMNVSEREERAGGAGSVAVDLAAMGAEVQCTGVVGQDDNGTRLKKMLSELANVNIEGLVEDESRPTTFKQRIIGLAQHRHRQQLMRIDEESNGPINAQTQKKLVDRLDKAVQWCDVVCLEDYNKGVLCQEFSWHVIASASKNNKKVIVDPASITDYSRYKGAWLIKPNRGELSLATGIKIDGEESWQQAACKLAKEYEIDNVVVTLDKTGAYLYQSSEDKGELVETRPRSVYDVTGAGDMVLAALSVFVGAKYKEDIRPSMTDIVRLANTAGGLEVERFGCVGVSRAEIATEIEQEYRNKTGKLRSLDALLAELQRQRDKTIVFTNGCFDLLHPGHIELLRFAKEQGDILIVALNSDNSVKALKGPDRPILKQQDRAALIGAMEMVDYVVIFDEPTPGNIIEKITPNVLIKGTDWKGNVVGQEWVEQHGGKVVLMPLVEGRSTTNIIDTVIKKLKGKGRKEEGIRHKA